MDSSDNYESKLQKYSNCQKFAKIECLDVFWVYNTVGDNGKSYIFASKNDHVKESLTERTATYELTHGKHFVSFDVCIALSGLETCSHDRACETIGGAA